MRDIIRCGFKESLNLKYLDSVQIRILYPKSKTLGLIHTNILSLLDFTHLFTRQHHAATNYKKVPGLWDDTHGKKSYICQAKPGSFLDYGIYIA